MIPIRDTVRSLNIPVINNLLIGINVVMFAVQLMQGSELGFQRFVYIYGLVPARYTMPQWTDDVTWIHQLTAPVSLAGESM